jgi:hypothetical protein
MRGLSHTLTRLVALEDGFEIGIEECNTDRYRHQPQRAADQVHVTVHIDKTPAKAEDTLAPSGLYEHVVTLHPIDRRHLLGGSVIHAEYGFN